MLKRFNKVFGIQSSIDEERKKFVQRINQELFEHTTFKNNAIFLKETCRQLGKNYSDLNDINTMNFQFYNKSEFRKLTNDNFIETLKVICCIYGISNNAYMKIINNILEETFSLALVDLDVRWNKGMFYPSGAKELDEKLVEEPLEWLRDYHDERKDFQKAIEGYIGKKDDEVISNCYLTIEGLARKVLNNRKTLDNNCEELLKKIGISQEWKSFLKNFMTYANEFKRHASEKRHSINPKEVEAFLYFTGLMVRLIVESKHGKT